MKNPSGSVSRVRDLSRDIVQKADVVNTCPGRGMATETVSNTSDRTACNTAGVTRELDALVTKIRDEECRRIVREIHDGVGQTLVALTINLQRMQSSLSPDSTEAQL